MRVIEAGHAHAVIEAPDAAMRSGRIELLALLACSAVVIFGIWLTYAGRIARLVESDGGAAPVLDLHHLAGADDLVPLLTMFDDDRERQTVAHALYRRATSESPRLDHVGGLASAAIPAAEIRSDPRLIKLRARLAQRPGAAAVPALTPSDIVALKPRLVVRTREQFAAAVRESALWFFGACWAAHLVRRW